MYAIKISINLDRYSAEQIIDLYNQGVITLSEIRESNRHVTTFGDELSKWLYSQEKILRNEASEAGTVIA